MANVKISDLPLVSTFSRTSVLPIVASGITKKVPALTLVGTVNVKWYGATGDGSTDDTTAIQAAINDIPTGTAGGYLLEFPPGIYIVTSALTIGNRRMILRGSGGGMPYSTTIKSTNANADIIDYSIGNSDSFGMQGMVIYGAGKGTGTGHGVVMGSTGQRAFSSTFIDCWFTGIPQRAIYSKFNNGLVLEACTLENSTYGWYMEDASNNNAQGCMFFSCTTGVFLGGATTGQSCAENILDGNTFYQCGSAAETTGGIVINKTGTFAARANTISNNLFRGSVGNDIVLNGNGGVNTSNTGVSSTKIIGNSSVLSSRRFLLATDANVSNIVGNTIDTCNQEAAGAFDAIEIAGTSDGNALHGNKVTLLVATAARPPYGLRLGSTTTNTLVGSNEWNGKTGRAIVVSGATFAPSDSLSGSWTPVIKGLSTSGTQTYTTQVGRFQRKGNLVWAMANIAMSALDGATNGFIVIDGLPFTSKNTSGALTAAAIGHFAEIAVGAGNILTMRLPASSTQLSFVSCVTGGAITGLTQAALEATTSISITIMYETDTGTFSAGVTFD